MCARLLLSALCLFLYVHASVCMYDYHIAVSIKTLAQLHASVCVLAKCNRALFVHVVLSARGGSESVIIENFYCRKMRKKQESLKNKK